MSNETKRDVFDELLEIAGNAMDQAMSAQYPSDENGCAPSGIGKAIRDILDPIEKRYAAALPDDLPVIPKAISDAIKFYWTTYGHEKGLTDLLFDLVEPWRIGVEKVVYAIHEDTRKYYLLHSDVIARAWVLGVWRVEETGEIVKLEEEK